MLATASLIAVDEQAPFPEVVKAADVDHPAEENSGASLFLEQVRYYNPEDAYLYRLHNDSYYHLVGLSDYGSVAQLNDSSKWSVHPSHGYIVSGWAQADNIFIKPYDSWFSSYKYVLFNHTLQQEVLVNLFSPPMPMVAQTFLIVNIEPNTRMVQLSDIQFGKSIHQIQIFIIRQLWHRLVVGVNNYWSVAPYANVLINVDMYREPYSQANFFGNAVGY